MFSPHGAVKQLKISSWKTPVLVEWSKTNRSVGQMVHNSVFFTPQFPQLKSPEKIDPRKKYIKGKIRIEGPVRMGKSF